MTLPPIDWTTPWPWLISALLLALLFFSLWRISKETNLSAGRRAVRVGLHVLLFLSLLGLFLQPRCRSQLPAGRVLLVADEALGMEIPNEAIRRVQDSLHIRQIIMAQAFRGATDSVVLLGQAFPDNILAQLTKQVVTWVPYAAAGQLQSLRWQGIVPLGQSQTISGQIGTTKADVLRVRLGQRTLDSTWLTTGNQDFILNYPVFALGRNSPTLWLGNTLLDTLHFVVRPTARMRIRFVLTAPDFETRTLADWLGQQGHQVELTSTLSKGIGSSLAINSAVSAKNTPPDLVITDPGNVTNRLVTNTLSTDKSVLVLNVSQADADVAAVNRALHTRWQLRRVPGKDTLHIGPVLTALPYRFVLTNRLLPVPGYPVAVQPSTGRVALSLLTETFPLRLSGDSVAYNRLWLSILAQLQPTSTNNLTIEAPVYQHLPAEITLNNPTVVPARLRIGNDTINLRPAPLNTRSWTGTIRPAQPGWQPLQDTLAVYVYATEPNRAGALGPLSQRQKTAAVALAHRRYDVSRPAEARFVEKELPDWAWFILITSLLVAIWVEPKV
ncbi:hypothetical protein [Fibrella aquatilis]|uniref:Aerotolerance regulator N-terminal domain-containing protein n=1 Tax=Fibrella aquatilis TaxID=2817059 RepID=A0A939JZ99_9BACT|nr:hypothetical protein [Fibrella aquatilis]MBO0929950.1 hypothetical protein [Fibrella aquatilis]